MGAVAAHRPQTLPGAARLHGSQSGQNLRHRTRFKGGHVVTGRCQQFGHNHHRRFTMWHQRVQLAVTLEISVLFHRAESSQGTTIENFKVQRRIIKAFTLHTFREWPLTIYVYKYILFDRHTRTHTQTHWNIYINVCVCVCVSVQPMRIAIGLASSDSD